MENEKINQLIKSVNIGDKYHPTRFPLDYHKSEWINAGLYTLEFFDFFTNNPNGETDIYKWDTKKADSIINLQIWIKK